MNTFRETVSCFVSLPPAARPATAHDVRRRRLRFAVRLMGGLRGRFTIRSTLRLAFGLGLCGALAACGGGGGGNSGGSTSTGGTADTSNSGASGTPSIRQSSTPNTQPVTVGAGVSGTRNILTTSVTVCVPGTSQCATIDNIQVDTGSQGLRLLASALPSTLALPALPTTSGVAAECAVFGGGYTWGAVRSADVRMAGELAAALPIQLIGDPAAPNVASDCASTGAAMQTTSTLHSNGILGIGVFAADCGPACASSALPRWYYGCDTSGACAATTQPLAQQVTNPVSAFALDNNGVVIALPAIGPDGAASVTGSLLFGIDTQANNTLGTATVLRTNPVSGYVTTVSNGQTYANSYLDSGSNALFIANAGLPQCGAWYCPGAPQSGTATISGTDGSATAVAYTVANATSLLSTSNYAFDNLAAATGNSFGWGLPFFYGKRIYTAIEARATSAGNGPFYAF